ncbi:hypothetical protein [Prosthecochloris sp.]|uniref:hypothetical protein n=1 Tax=Prosthecochloris sp. TaxID=290513 RepID=UPI0025F5122D|nr:hypothetical protein [Prosthecochloris sp.]
MKGLMLIAFLAVWVIARACGVPDLGAAIFGALGAVVITSAAELVRVKTNPRNNKKAPPVRGT